MLSFCESSSTGTILLIGGINSCGFTTVPLCLFVFGLDYRTCDCGVRSHMPSEGATHFLLGVVVDPLGIDTPCSDQSTESTCILLGKLLEQRVAKLNTFSA